VTPEPRPALPSVESIREQPRRGAHPRRLPRACRRWGSSTAAKSSLRDRSAVRRKRSSDGIRTQRSDPRPIIYELGHQLWPGYRTAASVRGPCFPAGWSTPRVRRQRARADHGGRLQADGPGPRRFAVKQCAAPTASVSQMHRQAHSRSSQSPNHPDLTTSHFTKTLGAPVLAPDSRADRSRVDEGSHG
jgi:hypothetical protein